MKKYIALILTFAIMFSTVACTKNNSETNNSEAVATTNSDFTIFASDNYCSTTAETNEAVFISLDVNGNIEGQAYEYRPEESTDEYVAGTIYGNVFTLTLSDLTAVDERTYSATVSAITYEYEPFTEEIEEVTKDDGTKGNVRNVYTKPLDGCENTKVYLYKEDIAIIFMPSSAKPYLAAFGLDVVTDGALLGTNALYFEGNQIAFVRLPE